MNPRLRQSIVVALARLNSMRAGHPRLFSTSVLLTVALLMGLHFTFGERMFHPEMRLWDSSRFSKADLFDLEFFANKLEEPDALDRLSQYLRTNLSDTTTNALAIYRGGLDSHLQQALAEDLNHLIQRGSIYDSNFFAHVRLATETKDLLGQTAKLSAAQLTRLNRMLLQDAYPCCISKHLFWSERSFWMDLLLHSILPIALWCIWNSISFGRLDSLPLIAKLVLVICIGDIVFYLIPINLAKAEEAQLFHIKMPLEYWNWWTLWTSTVVVTGNVVMLRRWWLLLGFSGFSWAGRLATTPITWTRVLFGAAIVGSGLAGAWPVGIHIVLPRMAISPTTLSVAERYLITPRLKSDFRYITSTAQWSGTRVGVLIDHIELADQQRQNYYKTLNDFIFKEYVLSADIDQLALAELNWRRTLCEEFYPFLCKERDAVAAAHIVVRRLRERVGIDPEYSSRVGIETIWAQQMTDEAGFERIYVAALRSVGIAARLTENAQAELWTGNAWMIAPRPLGSLLPTK